MLSESAPPPSPLIVIPEEKDDEQSETEVKETKDRIPVILKRPILVQRTRANRTFSLWVWDDAPSEYEDTAPWHEYPAAGASTQTEEVQEEEQEAQGAGIQATATQTGNPRARTKRRGAPRDRPPPGVRVQRRYEGEQRAAVEEARRAKGSILPASNKGREAKEKKLVKGGARGFPLQAPNLHGNKGSRDSGEEPKKLKEAKK